MLASALGMNPPRAICQPLFVYVDFKIPSFDYSPRLCRLRLSSKNDVHGAEPAIHHFFPGSPIVGCNWIYACIFAVATV